MKKTLALLLSMLMVVVTVAGGNILSASAANFTTNDDLNTIANWRSIGYGEAAKDPTDTTAVWHNPTAGTESKGGTNVNTMQLTGINSTTYATKLSVENNKTYKISFDYYSENLYNWGGSLNKKINVNEYLSAHSLMRSGDSEFTKLKLPEEQIGLVIDRFGTNIQCAYDGDTDIIVTLKSNLDDLYAWALENGDIIEVLEPQSVRNKIRIAVAQMYEKYSCQDLDKYDIEMAKSTRQILRNHHWFRCPDITLDDKKEWHNLTHLTDIFFENNRITDFSFTNTLKNLRKVSFENERISDLSFLYDLPKLSSLFLRETTVTDISCLDGLHIVVLHLVENYDLEDYSVLMQMKYLRVLYVDYETLEKINIEELKKINPKLTIWVEQENGKAIKL